MRVANINEKITEIKAEEYYVAIENMEMSDEMTRLLGRQHVLCTHCPDHIHDKQKRHQLEN